MLCCYPQMRSLPATRRRFSAIDLRACAPAPEAADADLASAWLDDAAFGTLEGDALEISPADANAYATAGDLTIVDLRTAAQFRQLHVPGAVSMSAGDPGPLGLLFHFKPNFEDEVSARFGDRAPLALLCDVGVVSRIAAERLRNCGFGKIAAIRGGFEAWNLEAEALPVVSDLPPPAEDSEDTAEAAVVVAGELDDEWDPAGEVGGAVRSGEEEVAELVLTLFEAEDSPLRHCPRGMLPPQSEHDLEAQLDLDLEGMDDELGMDLDELDDDLLELEGIFGTSAAAASSAAKKLKEEAVKPPNPLEGAEVDESLASLVVELDAPFAPTNAPASIATSTIAGQRSAPPPPPLSPAEQKAAADRAAKNKRASRRARGSMPPAWLVDLSKLNFTDICEREKLGSLNVKELKSFLWGRDAPLAGAKSVLVQRCREIIAAEAESGSSPDADAINAAAPFAAPSPAALGARGQGVEEEKEGEFQLFTPEASDTTDDLLVDQVFSAM